MFTVSRSPLYDFDTLFHTLDSVNQYQQQQLLQQQYEALRPKIVKKVETGDKYQIQIFKKQGNFNLYEVKVLRNAAYRSSLINLVIESRRDDFRRVFQFNLNDIEVGDIDWEYFQDDNVLVLNVPKKVKYCADDYVNTLLASMLGAQACAPCGHERKHKHRSHRKLKNERAEAAARAEAEKAEKARIEAAKAEAARIEAAQIEAARIEAARIEAAKAEAARKAEAERKARAEEARRLEKARKEEEKAQRVAQEKARRLAEVRARKEQAKKEKARSSEEEARKEQLQKQQEFLQSLFGGFFPGAVFREPQAATQVPTEKTPQKQAKQAVYESEVPSEPLTDSEPESETESIHSDDSTDSRASLKRSGEDLSSGVDKLHRHPSLEEVEDEEFVMFRKKFGEQ